MAELHSAPLQSVDSEAAAILVDALRDQLTREGRARLAIPGGSALGPVERVRRELADQWPLVQLTWVDERCVPFASMDSNRGHAYRSGSLSASHSPAFELPLWLDGDSPRSAVERVSRTIDDVFDGRLDVVLLGMGADGHIASIFPGHTAPAHGASVHFVADSPKPPRERMTLARALLSTALTTVLIATGEGKRKALRRLCAGDPSLPACGLPGLVVFTDLDLEDRP